MRIDKSLFILGCVVGCLSAAWLPVLISTAEAGPRLLPFQGRLTDANGVPVADGAKVVQFKIYDAPTGGTAVWNGEVQKLTVNGGLVSTLLGSKADLSSVDFNEEVYLEITVDANADNQITAADPPLLPRQSILPAVFAVEAQRARTLDWMDGNGVVQGSANWSVLFGPNTDPSTGKINASKLADGSITSTQVLAGTLQGDRLAPETLTSAQIGPNAVDTSEIKDSAVISAKILDGTIQPADVAAGYGLVPAGTIIATVLDTPSSGWLKCEGEEVAIASYPQLAAAIGTKFGAAASPATHFKLPDLRAMFLRGRNAGRTDEFADPDVTSRTAPGANKDVVGSVQGDELKSHSHSLKLGGDGFTAGGRPQRSSNHNDNSATEPTGGSETRPKNIYVNYFIKH